MECIESLELGRLLNSEFFIFIDVSHTILSLDRKTYRVLSVNTMKYKCLECDGNLIQTDSDVVCINCGLIAEQIYEKPTLQLINY